MASRLSSRRRGATDDDHPAVFRRGRVPEVAGRNVIEPSLRGENIGRENPSGKVNHCQPLRVSSSHQRRSFATPETCQRVRRNSGSGTTGNRRGKSRLLRLTPEQDRRLPRFQLSPMTHRNVCKSIVPCQCPEPSISTLLRRSAAKPLRSSKTARLALRHSSKVSARLP